MSTNYQHFLKNGLSSKLAQKKLIKNGLNQINPQKPPTNFFFLVSQFKNPLVLVLFIAAIITFFLHEVADTIVISLAITINTLLGYLQEKKAYKAMESLKNVLSYQAWVIRDGEKKEIDTKEIVVNDLIWLYEGDIVPADGIILETTNLLVNESIITGESDAVVKSAYPLNPQNIENSDLFKLIISDQNKIEKKHQVFAGTNIVSGSSLMLVSKTGMKTQMGAIAAHINQHKTSKTPLEKRLNALAKFITIGIVFISIGIFIYGISTNQNIEEMFAISVAIAVAAIPEGLVISLTAILAIGMQRILKKNALVRNLMAAETLGTVNCICVDKTGTLTEGKLKVVETKFTHEELAYKSSLLANDMHDALEISRYQWAKQLSQKNKHYPHPDEIIELNPKDETIPFSSENRFLAVRCRNEIFISGSPEELLKKSSLSPSLLKQEIQTINEWGTQGRRMLGFAYIKTKYIAETQKNFAQLQHNNFKNLKITWLGLMAFTDPVRKDVAKTIQQAQLAGINFKIITGDFTNTAISIATQIGFNIQPNQIIDGDQLKNISDQKLKKIVNHIILFARTNPSQKLRIINALKKNHNVIAMMGDGVNDAPALAAADIGIVVNSASQISKDTADMVLLDSNLKTIIHAIEEGRGIFDNLRKIILYLLSDTFAEVIIVITSLILDWPSAITAAQILWVNLVNDGLPNLALSLDPKTKGLLKRNPISPNEQLIHGKIRILIFLTSSITALVSLITFSMIYPVYGLNNARTVVFAIMSLDSIMYVFSCKSLTQNIWQKSTFNNKYLNITFLISLFFTILPIHLPFLQKILKTEALNLTEWGIVVSASLTVMVVIETTKLIYNKINKK